MSNGPSLRDLAEAALLAVVGIAAFLLFLGMDFGSTSSTADTLSRYIWAFTHTFAPTNQFEVFLEILIAAIGFVTVSRVSARVAVFASFGIYFAVSFAIAFFTAPV